jgi:hypothetical protein
MKEQGKLKPILREPEHMLFSKGNTCVELREAAQLELQDTRCVL